MLAYARAGGARFLSSAPPAGARVSPRAGVQILTPPPPAPETAESDSTDYVQVCARVASGAAPASARALRARPPWTS